MRPMTHSVGAVILALAGQAAAQPLDLADRTGGIIVADQTMDTVYLTQDLDGDGTASGVDEVRVFLAEDNGLGLGDVTGNVFGVFQSATGWVYLGDGDSDTVYRVRDTDGDGLPDEGKFWFTNANAAGYSLATPNGIWEPEPGVVFVLNAGAGSAPEDGIYRTEDLNADGDAEDAGEAQLWMDLYTIIDSSSAFEIAFIGEAAYFADLRGGDTDAIIRAHDANGDGTVGTDEWVEFIDADNPWGVPIGFVAETDGTSLYVIDNLSGNTQTVYRLTDLDASGVIDDAFEVEQVWHESYLPGDAGLGSAFTLALGPEGTMAIGSSGGDDQDAVVLLTDLDGDGVYLTEGETTIWRDSGAGSDEFVSRARVVEFALGEGCSADFDGDGTVDTRDVLAFLNAWGSGDMAGDFNGDGNVDTIDVIEFLNAWVAGC